MDYDSIPGMRLAGVAMTVVFWIIVIAILTFGVLHVYQTYLVLRYDSSESAPTYMAWLKMVPYVVIDAVLILAFLILRK